MSTGSFQVGPAPDGETLTGQLTNAQFTQVAQSANAVASSIANAPQSCPQSDALANPNVQITLTSSDGTQNVVFGQPNIMMCDNASIQNVMGLKAALDSLLVIYYPVPFPTEAQPPMQPQQPQPPHNPPQGNPPQNPPQGPPMMP